MWTPETLRAASWSSWRRPRCAASRRCRSVCVLTSRSRVVAGQGCRDWGAESPRGPLIAGAGGLVCDGSRADQHVAGGDASEMYRRIDPDAATAEDLLTADEVAALLRMTPAWVYAETRRNRIPHMRLGRYFRYRRSAIEAWMGDLEAGPSLPRAARRGAQPGARQPPARGSSSRSAAL